MSRSFARASSQYLTINTPVLTDAPLTMACWFNLSDNTNAQALISIADNLTNGTYFWLAAHGSTAGDPVICGSITGGGSEARASTTTGYSLNTWHHACGVFVSNTERHVYIDGGGKGTNTDTGIPSGLDNTNIGHILRPGQGNVFPNGLIAEAAIWGVALTDAEAAVLAKGFSPLLVRPTSLAAYWLLIGRTSPEIDIIGGYGLTLVNTPVVGVHPRMLYAARISSMSLGVGGAGPGPSFQPRPGAAMLSGVPMV